MLLLLAWPVAAIGDSRDSPTDVDRHETGTSSTLRLRLAGIDETENGAGSDADPTGDRVADLIRATRHAAWKKRWDAVNELGRLREPRGIPALVERALHDDNSHPRWRSLWALHAIDRTGDDVVPMLRKGLEDENPVVVHNAAVALAFFGRPEARAHIVRALDDPTDFRRWEAVYSFRKLGGSAAVDMLVPLLDAANEPSPRVRGEAALVLGGIGGDKAAAALLRALRLDSSGEVRWRAARALAGVSDACLAGELQDALAAETDTRVREQIGKTIAKMQRADNRGDCPGQLQPASP